MQNASGRLVHWRHTQVALPQVLLNEQTLTVAGRIAYPKLVLFCRTFVITKWLPPPRSRHSPGGGWAQFREVILFKSLAIARKFLFGRIARGDIRGPSPRKFPLPRGKMNSSRF